MPRKVTLRDVAREVGLSASAVSQVLNNRPCRLSEESKERIREVAARLDYRANRMARGLALSRTDTLGIIIPDVENPFFASLAKHLEACCRATGRGLFITNSNDDAAYDCELLRRLDDRGVDGIAYVPSTGLDESSSAHICEAVQALSAACVMLDRSVPCLPCDFVHVDNRAGGALAAVCLLDAGHTRIACLANSKRSANGALRLAGFTEALAARGLAPDCVLECEYHADDGYAAAGHLNPDVTAVFATSDLITAGVLHRFYEMGVRVPEDVSLVTFDNSSAFIQGGPGITAVAQDTAELARLAFERLVARIEGEDAPAVECVVAPTLVPKASVRPR